MEIKLTNVGAVDSAAVKVNGLTVIAGMNATGKSTVLKSLYSIIESSSNLERDIEGDIQDVIRRYSLRRDSDETLIRESDLDILKHALESENRIRFKNLFEIQMMADYLEGRADTDSLYRTNLMNTMKSSFSHQILKMGCEKGTVEFTDGDSRIELELSGQDIGMTGNRPYYSSVSYIDTPLVVDFLDNRLFGNHMSDHRAHLFRQLMHPKEESIFRDDSDEFHRNSIDRLISEVIGGRFERTGLGLAYSSEDVKGLRPSNLASGMKMFSIVKLLLDNGYIDGDSVLLLDEPEIHLHPEWQLIFAEVLVLLCKQLGTRIVLTTHSPQFLASIEAYCEREGLDADFYNFIKDSEGRNVSTEVTGHTQDIYRPMAEAFSKASSVGNRDE